MELASIQEVSDFLKVKKSTLYSWVHTLKIPFFKVNGLIRFDMEEIRKWVKKSKRMVVDELESDYNNFKMGNQTKSRPQKGGSDGNL